MPMETARRVLSEAQIDESQYVDYLYEAIEVDNRDVVELLLKAGVSVTTPDAEGLMPLVNAALMGSKECIVAIIEHGAVFPAILENDVETACRVARETGSEDCAQLILTHVERVAGEMLRKDGIYPEFYDIALLTRAARNEVTILRLLLWAGANVNAVDEDGESALVKAALNGHAECLRMLLAADGVVVAGADGASGRTPLQAAVEGGWLECVKILLEDSRVSVNQTTVTHPVAPLHLALLRGNAAIAEALLSHKDIETSLRTDMKQTILHSAVASGNQECLDLVLQRAPELCNAQDYNGYSPLHIAAMQGHVNQLKLLLDTAKVDMELRDKSGATPLILAIKNAKKETVRAILEYPGIIVNREVLDACCGEDAAGIREMIKTYMMENAPKVLLAMGIEPTQYESSLFQAVGSGDELVFDLLMRVGVSCNAKNEAGTPIVCEAARHGNLRALETMLNKPGCSLFETTRDGQHALHLAAAAGKVECVQYLSGLCPSLLFRGDLHDRIPLDVAAPVESVDIMLEKGMVEYVLKSLKLQGDREAQMNAALFEIVRNNDARLFSLFLRAGADVNAKLNEQTVLDFAIREGQTELVKMMLRNEALDIEITSWGMTPLHAAVEANEPEIVKLLLEDGQIDVNQQNVVGDTPLSVAACYDYLDIVQSLLDEENVSVKVRNEKGRSPIHLAVENGNLDVVKAIIRHDSNQLNYADAAGRTPLYEAARFDRAEVLGELLKYQKLNAEATFRQNRMNPLHVAALNGNYECLKILVRSDQFRNKVNVCDAANYSPLCYAAQSGSLDCVKLLLPTAPELALGMALSIAEKKGHTGCFNEIRNALNSRLKKSN